MDGNVPDADLVRQTLQGQTEAFHQLTVRYYRPVGGFILKRVQRPDLVSALRILKDNSVSRRAWWPRALP